MKHVVQVGWVVDGINANGDTYYFQILFCDQCHTAGHVMKLSKEIDDKPIISRIEYKVLTPWPSECPASEG